MKYWLILFLALAATVHGAPFPEDEISENRFLFIVDTSYDLRHDRKMTELCVSQLIRSGVDGRLQTGDTFGIWTFNKEVLTKGFPMHVWTQQLNETLAKQAKEFLEAQSYDYKCHMENLVRPLSAVATSSASLLVFLITDGEHPFAGTRFDKEINFVLNRDRHLLEKNNVPFVVVLGVENGEFTKYTVNSIYNIRVPEIARVALPTSIPAAITNAPKVALIPLVPTNAPPPPAPRIGHSLELVGPLKKDSVAEHQSTTEPTPQPGSTLDARGGTTTASSTELHIPSIPTVTPAVVPPLVLPPVEETVSKAEEPPAPRPTEVVPAVNPSARAATSAPPATATFPPINALTGEVTPLPSVPSAGGSNWMLWLAGAVFLLGIGVAWKLSQPGRRSGSLISRSINHPRG